MTAVAQNKSRRLKGSEQRKQGLQTQGGEVEMNAVTEGGRARTAEKYDKTNKVYKTVGSKLRKATRKLDKWKMSVPKHGA